MANRQYWVWDRRRDEDDEWIKFYFFYQAYAVQARVLLDNELKEAELGKKYPEEIILPIFLLIHTALELGFKSLLSRKGISVEEYKGHILSDTLKLVKKHYPNLDLGKECESYIKDFDYINEKGQSVRYPSDKKGKHFWITKGGDGRYFNLAGIVPITKETFKKIDDYFKEKISPLLNPKESRNIWARQTSREFKKMLEKFMTESFKSYGVDEMEYYKEEGISKKYKEPKFKNKEYNFYTLKNNQDFSGLLPK